ncbi:MAG: hypothetical protein F6K04_22020 [Leptolyngbya sp. SIO4C5]|nr:hypothetical protein [Leptolyngbya sp. SIO4C5]
MKMPDLEASPAFDGQDPPLNDVNFISAKPVDFYADPDRRPHGFRLRNGIDISNGKERRSGMTFVTDNSVYIQGNLNLHSSNGELSGLLEEFESPQTLLDGKVKFVDKPSDINGSDFYSGRETTKRNIGNFADVEVDHWRPVEIMADAITILSDSFKDGSVDHFFIRPSPTYPAKARGQYNTVIGEEATSYLNANRFYFEQDDASLFTSDKWVHEIEGDASSPIWVGRDAEFAILNGSTPIVGFTGEEAGAAGDASYLVNFDIRDLYLFRQNNQIRASDTYVNALMISGIVPMRAGQGYGGMHNFPRLLEYWADVGEVKGTSETLYLYGSLFQLNFSRAATAPFDQDVWEPSTTPADPAVEKSFYYGAAQRNWGYDVAQLYVPPGPISSRFVNIPEARSEFYRELSADDPYILNLRCARAEGESTPFLDDRRTTGGQDVCPR